MTSNTGHTCERTCFSFYMAPKFLNKPFALLFYKRNNLHFSLRVHCNRSKKTSQSAKYNSHATRVVYFLYFTRCDVICDLLQYTRTEKCNVFVNTAKAYYRETFNFWRVLSSSCIIQILQQTFPCIFSQEMENIFRVSRQ